MLRTCLFVCLFVFLVFIVRVLIYSFIDLFIYFRGGGVELSQPRTNRKAELGLNSQHIYSLLKKSNRPGVQGNDGDTIECLAMPQLGSSGCHAQGFLFLGWLHFGPWSFHLTRLACAVFLAPPKSVPRAWIPVAFMW